MAVATRRQADEEESYFVSMTDLMVGLIFVFIIMLMFFALQYRQSTDQLVNANAVRREILLNLKALLAEKNIRVEVVEDQGILRFPEGILFDKAKAELNPMGEGAVDVLGAALDQVLPCYTTPMRAVCPSRRAPIESIYVEGHTDNDPLTPRADSKDNLDLSAKRAANTFRRLVDMHPDLLMYLNPDNFPVLGVSGYGEYRPVVKDQNTEAAKAENRRIDLRILMATPRLRETNAFEDLLNQRGGGR